MLVAMAVVAFSPLRAESWPGTPGGEAAEPIYRIGAFDTLEIDVRGEPDLSRTVTVRPDGRFSLPFAENVPAAGRTPEEVARDLESRFGTLLRDPRVSVMVTTARGQTDQLIRVIGSAAGTTRETSGRGAVLSEQVGRPQEIPYRAGITLVDVITEVGGLSRFAAGNDAYIVRRQGDAMVNLPVRIDDLIDAGDPTANVTMRPGDVLVIPEGPFSGEWRLEPTLGTYLTFTDNIALVPNNFKDPGYVATVAPGIILFATTPRFAVSLDADVELRYKGIFGPKNLDIDTGVEAYLNLIGSSTTEVISNAIFVDVNAAVTQEARNSDDATSVSPFVDTNRGTAASATFRPFYRHRLGDYADGQFSYQFGAFVFNDDDSSVIDVAGEDSNTTISNEVRYRLDSGTEFQKFGWGLSARALHQTRSDEDALRRADVDLNLSYPLSHAFDAIGSIGYQWFRDGSTNDFNGVSWSIGGDYHPSRRLTMRASFGKREDRRNFSGDLSYNISPRTSFRLSYFEELTTSEQQFTQNVGDLQRAPDGSIVGPGGQPFDPATGDFDFEENTQFRRSFQASFDTRQGPNVFAASARVTLQTTEPEGTDDNTYSGSVSWTRTIDTRTSGQVSVGYTVRNRQESDDNTITFRTRLDHNLFRNVDAFVEYGLQHRDSTDETRDFLENVVTFGLLQRF